MNIKVYQRRNWLGRLQWYIRCSDKDNNRIRLQSEGYNNLRDALDTVDWLCRAAPSAALLIVNVKGKEVPYDFSPRRKAGRT